jgi:tetratricopeptide (TPR) repeat protein
MVEVSRQEVIQSAERLVRRGRIEAAIDEYRKVLHDEPDDTRTLNRVGDLFLRLDKMGQAIDLFCRAADHFSREGFFVKAIAIYKKVIRVDPTRIEAYEELANLYHRQGLTNEARSQYQVVADYYGQQSNRRSQLSVFRKMAEIDPEDPSPRLRLAEAYLEDERPQDAMEQYRLIAGLMLAHDRVDDAAQVYRRAVKLDPGDLGFLTDAVLELKERGYVEAAHQLVESCAVLNPEAARVAELVNLSGSDGEPEAREPAASSASRGAAPPGAPPVEIVEQAASAVEAPADEIAEDLADFVEDDIEQWAAGPALDPAPTPPAVEVDSTVFFLDVDDPSMQATMGIEGGAVEFEIGLDELEASERQIADATPTVEPAKETAEDPLAEISFDDLDLDLGLGQPVDDTAEQILELIAEAQVLATYGLDEAAAERFERVVALDSGRAEAYLRLVEIHVQARDEERLASVVERANAACPEVSNAETWVALRSLLEGEGYGLEAGRLLTPDEAGSAGPPTEPAAAVAESALAIEHVDEAVAAQDEGTVEVATQQREAAPAVWSELSEEALEESVAEPATRWEEAGLEGPRVTSEEIAPESPFLQVVESHPSEIEPPTSFADLPVSEPPVSDSLAVPSPEPTGELLADEGADEGADEAAEAAPPGVSDDSALRWLDELSGDLAARKAAEEQMFGNENEFFDLAAELEEELREEEQRRGEPIAPPAVEQSLEEIVEGFKEGVAATLAKEDYDTHYNLGVAYREMGLIDEAIGEFQLAAKDPRYLVDSCSLLGACFLEKGFGDLAIKWYRRGLDSPAVSEDETLGLLYEMGNLHLALGNVEEARQSFVEIYGANSNYRDVVARLADLRTEE